MIKKEPRTPRRLGRRHPLLLGVVADSKNKVGPDSRTSLKMSDGQSDIFGQNFFVEIGRKSDEKSEKVRRKSDKSRTEVGQKDKNDQKPFNFGENSKKVVIKSDISRTRTKCRTVGQKSDRK